MNDFRTISIETSPQEFTDVWVKFQATHETSPYYLPTTLEYFRAYSGKRLAAERSFVVVRGDEPVALAFVPIEEVKGKRSISIGQYFTLAPLWEPLKNLLGFVMAEIDRIATETKAAKAMFRIDLLQHKQYPYNFLLNYDYLNTSLLGYLVDCGSPSWRRNHERAIRKISSNPDYSVYIMDQTNKDYVVHEHYRQLHHKAAGKVTRSKESFDLQYRMLEEGNAILVGLKHKDRFIAFTYFMFYKNGAISFSAADDPEYNELPLYHIINAEGLKYLQKHGVLEMDMGQPLNISNQPFNFPDQKQKNITLFKTGFEGRFMNEFRAIKYFTKETFLEDQQNFSKRYQEALS
ncbi:MAG: GNAT family N-acetyltransferase [bacterium]|nr:GNAT family N-acetyltransferase [bacterium]